MNNLDKQYLDLLKDILENGVEKDTRAGKVKSVFGRMMHFNLKEGLPILTTKKMYTKGVIHELLWFLKGSTNIKYLVENNVHIWDDDAYRYYTELIKKNNEIAKDVKILFGSYEIEQLSKEDFLKNVLEEKTMKFILKHSYFDDHSVEKGEILNYTFGDLGPVYGKSWRNFGTKGVDQIQKIIKTLKSNPDDRRMLCVAFNPDVLDEVALPPCHTMIQFYTKPLANGKRELSCMWSQRSVDCPLGWGFNVLSYSLLTHMIAQVCDMEVGEVVCSLGDCHIYLNQIEGIEEQLTRDPYKFDLPSLELNPNIKDINDFKYEDFKIINYQSYDKIKMPLSVG